ncbi:MAG: prolyl oligopeptidase family serine peptidase [Opitutaceae bacterium]|nr:prolyl oligopeptidase family serine peptidase [Opitutaceae bacterium]
MPAHPTSLRTLRLARLFALAAWLIAPSLGATDTAPRPASEVAAPPPLPATSATPASAQARSGDRFADFFAPFRTDIATLSPDGKHLAYSLREDDRVSVLVVEVEHPQVAKAKVVVISDAQATPALAIGSREKVPARILWMRWATPTRLVLETNRAFATSNDTSWASHAGEVLAFDADGGNAVSLADASRVVRQAGAGYRPPRVIGFDPKTPEAVLVLGDGGESIGRFSIHTQTRKMDYLSEEILDSRMVMLLDRTGKPRIGIEYNTSKKFPLPFVLETGKFGRPWRPLDEIAASERLASFAMTPGSYFGERSVPLGFDASGNLLYFASNTGRDTFGIYALDLTTGKKSGTAIENPSLDLWEPVAGVFPDLKAAWFSESPSTGAEETDISAASTGEETEEEAQEDPVNAPAERGDTEIQDRQNRSRVSTAIEPARNTDDRILVFDRFTDKVIGLRAGGPRPTTHWFRPDLNEAQALLEDRFRGQTVEIREWDSGYATLLVSVSGPAHAGTHFVFNRTARSAFEFSSTAPWLAPLVSKQMLGFAFDSPQGVRISGMITVPRAPRVKPIPAIILTPRVPWQTFEPVFRAEVHALAEMGFAVIEYSGRGAWGRGRALRERLREGYEDAQVEDLLATADYAAKHFAIAEKRLAVAGLDHGGHVALRALELAPERFRCAVAINAPVNIRTWLGEMEWSGASAAAQLVSPAFGDIERQKAAPLVRDLGKIQRPALMFNFRGPVGATATNNYTAAKQFALSVNRRVEATEIVDLNEDYMNGLPKARAAVFARIEEFLNANVYDYTVKAGELQVDEPKEPPAAQP